MKIKIKNKLEVEFFSKLKLKTKEQIISSVKGYSNECEIIILDSLLQENEYTFDDIKVFESWLDNIFVNIEKIYFYISELKEIQELKIKLKESEIREQYLFKNNNPLNVMEVLKLKQLESENNRYEVNRQDSLKEKANTELEYVILEKSFLFKDYKEFDLQKFKLLLEEGEYKSIYYENFPSENILIIFGGNNEKNRLVKGTYEDIAKCISENSTYISLKKEQADTFINEYITCLKAYHSLKDVVNVSFLQSQQLTTGEELINICLKHNPKIKLATDNDIEEKLLKCNGTKVETFSPFFLEKNKDSELLIKEVYNRNNIFYIEYYEN